MGAMHLGQPLQAESRVEGDADGLGGNVEDTWHAGMKGKEYVRQMKAEIRKVGKKRPVRFSPITGISSHLGSELPSS